MPQTPLTKAQADKPAQDCKGDDQSNLAEAVKDARTLVEFSARQGITLDSGDIMAVIETSKLVLCTAPIELPVDDELRFWEAFNTISAKVAPVTVEGIRTTTELKTGYLAALGISSEASRFLMRTKWLAVITFLSIMVVQIYWMIGVQIFNDVIKTEVAMVNIEKELDTKLSGVAPLVNAPYVALKQAAITKNDAATMNLKYWNEAWRETLFFVTFTIGTAEYEGSLPEVKKRVQYKSAETALKTLSEYMLPALYALLGSLVFILRKSTEKIHLYTFTSLSKFRMGSRWLLGMISGVAISWVFAPEGTAKTANGELATAFNFLLGLGPWAAAFVIGYNVEIIYRLLDRIDRKSVV